MAYAGPSSSAYPPTATSTNPTPAPSPLSIVIPETILPYCDLPNFLIAGTILCNMVFDIKDLERRLRSLWRPQHGLFIRVLEKNLFVFCFYHRDDVEWVMDNGPWWYLNRLLALVAVSRLEDINRNIFKTVPFWVQISGLPYSYLTAEVGRLVGGLLGKVITVDAGETTSVGYLFLRAKILISIPGPLRAAAKVQIGGSHFEAQFAYERLPDFCIRCGFLDHIEADCEARPMNPFTGRPNTGLDPSKLRAAAIGRPSARGRPLTAARPLSFPQTQRADPSSNPVGASRIPPEMKGKGIARSSPEPQQPTRPSHVALPPFRIWNTEPQPPPPPKSGNEFSSSNRRVHFGPFQPHLAYPWMHPNEYYQPFASPFSSTRSPGQSMQSYASRDDSQILPNRSYVAAYRTMSGGYHGGIAESGGSEDRRIASPVQSSQYSVEPNQFVLETNSDLSGYRTMFRHLSVEYGRRRSRSYAEHMERWDPRERMHRRFSSAWSLVEMAEGKDEPAAKRTRLPLEAGPSSPYLSPEEDPSIAPSSSI